MQQKVLVTDPILVFWIENYSKEWARSKAIEKGIILFIVGIKKVPDQTEYAIVLLLWFKFVESFSELMKNLSDVPKLETFVYFTKVTLGL